MSFQQGLSGLNAMSKDLEVIGNNIANANTYGSKASRAEFADVYAAALNGAGTNQIGIGVRLQTVAQQFTQGNTTTTDNPLDLAINGQGFFQVGDAKSPITYSRNGQFKIDANGYIVNNANKQLMGYAANDQGVIQPGKVVPMQLPTGGVPPKTTDQIKMELNLDARKGITKPTTGNTIDYNNPDTFNDATSMTVYDSKGQAVAMTFYFQKTATDTWDVYATANGNDVGGSNATPAPVTTLVFSSNGNAPTSPTFPLSFNIPATTDSNGATTLPITGVSLYMDKATQWGSAYGVTDITQSGFAAGQLKSVTVENNGVITARYSNGQAKPAGQIELANFRDPQGLQPMGDNAWARTFASGDPLTSVPGEGNMGSLKAGALEESNVDLTGELVNMITAQRIYQANAQTIKAQDQILQTLVNLR